MEHSIGPIRRSVAINVASVDQTVAPSRGVYVSSNGNLVCRQQNDAADVTYTGLVAGTVYPFSVSTVRKTGTTIAGLLLY